MNARHKHALLFKQKTAITVGALLVFAIRLVFPSLPIDAISLGLLVIAVLPWLSSLIKSAELPGLGKIEFQDVKSAVDKIESIEASGPADSSSENQASYLAIAEQNPSLALVGLRIEIEKRLRALSEKAGIPKSRPLTQLTHDLAERNLLTQRSVGGLLDLITLGNQAAHGVEVSEDAAYSAVEFGPEILRTLDSKLKRFQ